MTMQKYASAAVLSAERRPSFFKRAFRRVAHKATFDYEPREGYIYVRSRMISSRCNDNFDEFPASEIKKGYRTFIGRPVYVNHDNDDPSKARGVIIDAALHEDETPQGLEDTWVEGLMEIDAVTYPMLAEALLNGDIERTSMGVNIEYSICSFCGNKAETPLEYCRHVPAMKGSTATRVTASGEKEDVLIRERCYGLNFFENSVLVEPPADPTAHFLDVDDRGVGGGYKGTLAKAASRRTASLPEGMHLREVHNGFEVLRGSEVMGAVIPFGPRWQASVRGTTSTGDSPEGAVSAAYRLWIAHRPMPTHERMVGDFPAGVTDSLRGASRRRTAMPRVSDEWWHVFEDVSTESGPRAGFEGEYDFNVTLTKDGNGFQFHRGRWAEGPFAGHEAIVIPTEFSWRMAQTLPGGPNFTVALPVANTAFLSKADGPAPISVAASADWTTIEDQQGWAAGELAMDDEPLPYQKGDRLLYREHGRSWVVVVDSDNGSRLDVMDENGIWRADRENVQRRMGRRLSGARLEDARVPVEVNTLTGGDCPVCGNDNYDGNECDTCGYADPGETFTEPDLSKAKEFRETGEAPADDAEEGDFETLDDAEESPEGDEFGEDEGPTDIDEALHQPAPEDEALLQEALDMLKEVREMIGPDALDKSLRDEVRETMDEMRELMESGDGLPEEEQDLEGLDEDVEQEDPLADEESEETPFETADDEESEEDPEEPEDDDEDDDDNPFGKKSRRRKHSPRQHFR